MECPSIPLSAADTTSWFCLLICATCHHAQRLYESHSHTTTHCPLCGSPTGNFDSDFGLLGPSGIAPECTVFYYRHYWRCWCCEKFVLWESPEIACAGCGWRREAGGCVVFKIWDGEAAGRTKMEMESMAGGTLDLSALGAEEVLFWGDVGEGNMVGGS